MGRQLDTKTLDDAAKHYAVEFLRPDQPSKKRNGTFIAGRAYVEQDFFRFDFKDEFEYMYDEILELLGPKPRAEFEAMAAEKFTPRSDEVFVETLAEKLAIDPDGNHVSGRIGTVKVDERVICMELCEVETTDSVRRRRRLGLAKTDPGARTVEQRLFKKRWAIYAGEAEERAADSGVADPLPEGAEGLPVGALNTRIANVIAIKACDIIVDELDTGTADGQLVGRTGAQVADPDTAPVGTILFEHDLGTPAFGAAVDNTGSARATANAVADDIAANATGTLGWLRASSSNAFPTALDDLIDGEAGTSGADFNYNTLAIVSGATVSLTSWTVDMPEA